jgi:hypothetical protein
MCKIRSPLDPITHFGEVLKKPLKGTPFQAANGDMGPVGQKSVETPFPDAAAPVDPVSADDATAMQARADLRQSQMIRKNFKSTMKAGDNGGWNPMKSPLVPPQGKL